MVIKRSKTSGIFLKMQPNLRLVMVHHVYQKDTHIHKKQEIQLKDHTPAFKPVAVVPAPPW